MKLNSLLLTGTDFIVRLLTVIVASVITALVGEFDDKFTSGLFPGNFYFSEFISKKIAYYNFPASIVFGLSIAIGLSITFVVTYLSLEVYNFFIEKNKVSGFYLDAKKMFFAFLPAESLIYSTGLFIGCPFRGVLYFDLIIFLLLQAYKFIFYYILFGRLNRKPGLRADNRKFSHAFAIATVYSVLLIEPLKTTMVFFRKSVLESNGAFAIEPFFLDAVISKLLILVVSLIMGMVVSIVFAYLLGYLNGFLFIKIYRYFKKAFVSNTS